MHRTNSIAMIRKRTGLNSSLRSLSSMSATDKLIVVAAFDWGNDGQFVQSFGPAEQKTEEGAIELAEALDRKHQCVVAWSRQVDPQFGQDGPLTILFQSESEAALAVTADLRPSRRAA